MNGEEVSNATCVKGLNKALRQAQFGNGELMVILRRSRSSSAGRIIVVIVIVIVITIESTEAFESLFTED